MSSFRSVVIATIATTLTWAGSASATGVDEASSTGKGIVGGALLGAEAVMLTEAVIGVKPRWAYFVGGGAGAVAGGVGGYFLEQNLSAKTNMFVLSAGMVLAIPTTIAMLAATQFEPPANYVQDQAPEDEPIANPPEVSRATSHRTAPRAKRTRQLRTQPTLVPAMPPALVGLDETSFQLAIPAIALVDVYTPRQMSEFGVEQRTELRMPVFNYVF